MERKVGLGDKTILVAKSNTKLDTVEMYTCTERRKKIKETENKLYAYIPDTEV